MKRLPTRLSGPALIESTVHRDQRGFMLEAYRADRLGELARPADWVQDNVARSARGVLRGMHFSVDPGQAKLVRCTRGAIRDVAVDLRRGSPTFAGWESWDLDDESGRMVYVPRGFAHGYLALSEVADVVYKCNAYYDPGKERAIAWDDPEVGIEWPTMEVTVSARDGAAPRLAEIADDLPFVYEG